MLTGKLTDYEAGEEYVDYMVVFGSERHPNVPEHSHTFAGFLRCVPGAEAVPGEGEPLCISWLPKTRVIRPLWLVPEPGWNFDLIETMLYEPGGELVLLERHMDRLRTSAHYFAFAFDEAATRRALAETVKGKADRLRVRLLLSEGGAVSITTTPLPPAKADAVMRFVLSPTRLNSADIFLFHKTTRREMYDREWQHYSESAGADEVIYLNERGELAEGSRTTIFLEKDGHLLTPELSSGLLAGTLRADLLASGRAREAVLTINDLEAADAIYLGNSVRGLVRAQRIDR